MATHQQEMFKMLPGAEMEEQTLKKKGNTILTLGVNNTGFNFALKCKELITKQSLTTLGFNKNESGTIKYYCTHQTPPHRFLNLKDVQSSFTCEVDTKKTKYESREEVLSWELQAENTPWRLRLERSSRENQFSAFNSKRFLEEESMPTTKSSVTLDYTQFKQGNRFSRVSAEVAVPLEQQSPSFFKLEAKLQNLFMLIPDKISLVTDLQAGYLIGQTFQNDRFFLYNTMGYLHLGHNQKSLQPEPKQKIGQNAEIILGDDLGTDKYFYACLRLNYLNLPVLKKAGARLFGAVEVAYYPTDKQNNVRGSCGFGANLPLNDMISIALYHNFGNFNSKLGDIERTSFVNFTFQFF